MPKLTWTVQRKNVEDFREKFQKIADETATMVVALGITLEEIDQISEIGHLVRSLPLEKYKPKPIAAALFLGYKYFLEMSKRLEEKELKND